MTISLFLDFIQMERQWIAKSRGLRKEVAMARNQQAIIRNRETGNPRESALNAVHPWHPRSNGKGGTEGT
jgi:hypothetical protein